MQCFGINRALTGAGKLLKVMEIDNVIFQDLENFAKGSLFEMAIEKLWIFLEKF